MEWKYFSVWKWKADFCQNTREMERMAVLHYDHCIVMHHLRAWRIRTHDRLKDIHNWVCILISALYTQPRIKCDSVQMLSSVHCSVKIYSYIIKWK